MSWLRTEFRRIDGILMRFSTKRRVLVDARTAMNFAILAPVFERLHLDPRVEVLFAADRPADVADAAKAAGVRSRIHARRRSSGAESICVCPRIPGIHPAATLRRRANFFHGIAESTISIRPAACRSASTNTIAWPSSTPTACDGISMPESSRNTQRCSWAIRKSTRS